MKPNFQEVEDHQVKVASHTNNKTSANNFQEAPLNRKVDSSTSLELESTNTSPLFWEPSRILFQKLLDISLLERVKIH